MSFVRASELYDVQTGTRIRHPAFDATDEDVRQAIESAEKGRAR
ncbi:MAG: hypothetical protein ACQETI_12140 [Halobacteriota archaeon]